MKNKSIFLFNMVTLVLVGGMLCLNGFKKELPNQLYDYLIISFGILIALNTLTFIFVLIKNNTKKMP